MSGDSERLSRRAFAFDSGRLGGALFVFDLNS